MKQIKVVLLPFVWIILAGNAGLFSSQDSSSSVFTQGNSEYQKGNYASAEQYYSRILKSGADSGALYYNLGNACFKQKRLGEAIYYWEKALQKLPADRDIKENLDFASLLIVDRIESPSDP
jgi:tetratricopeptide (TPR) repeat protein